MCVGSASPPPSARSSKDASWETADGCRRFPGTRLTPLFRFHLLRERLWFLQQLNPSSAAYHVRVVRRLRGELVLEHLDACFADLVRRHDALRTIFLARDGIPEQVVLPTLAINMEVDDWRDRAAADQLNLVARCVDEETARPMDLRHGPLVRVRVMRLGDHDHVLLIIVHHIIADGWSLGVLFRELGELYAARCLGTPWTLDEPPLQFADFAVWQRNWLTPNRIESDLADRRAQLADAPVPIELPADRARPLEPTHRGAVQPVRIDVDLTRALAEIGRRVNASLHMVLLAAFKVLLARHTGQSDGIVGSPSAGRNRRDLESVIGCFVNTLALRTNLGDNPSFIELLRRVRRIVLDGYEHETLPFERVVTELRPERALHATPFFQVLFAFQGGGEGGLRLPGIRVEPVELSTTTSAKQDVTVLLTERAGEVTGVIEFATNLFDAATIERLVERFMVLLRGIAAMPEARVWEISLLSAAEQAAVVRRGQGAEAPVPAVGLEALVAAQAARTPTAVAVEAGTTQLTYAELAAQAARVAGICGRTGWARKRAWPCVWSGPRNWWWPSSGCSKPGRRMCRWTRSIRPSESRCWWPMPARR